jgi:hypothetical protein
LSSLRFRGVEITLAEVALLAEALDQAIALHNRVGDRARPDLDVAQLANGTAVLRQSSLTLGKAARVLE